MTQTLGTNENNDIYLSPTGNIVLLQGQTAVEAACASISKVNLGEEALSTVSGLPFFTAVFTGVPNLAVFEAALLEALLGVEGVIAVNDITSQLTKDDNGNTVLSYTATIESQFGLTFTISEQTSSPA